MTSPHLHDTVPHSARIWSYWLGGKGHYPVDRQAADAFEQVFPLVRPHARASRDFLARAVRHLAADLGVRQFLDLGAGLPVAQGQNVHEIAQGIHPAARVVYVDYDPEVILHVEDLTGSTPPGQTAYLQADMGDHEEVLRQAGATLDLTEPVAVLLSDVMGHVAPLEAASAMTRAYLDAVPSGSHLLLSHSVHTEHEPRLQEYLNATGAALPYHLRTMDEVRSLFDGLDLIEPGLVPQPQWRPTPASPDGPPTAGAAGVARKP